MIENFSFIIEPLQSSGKELVQLLPRVLGAMVFFTLGWLFAKVVRKISVKWLEIARLDTLSEKAGIEDFLIQGGVRLTTVKIVSNILYWFILFAVVSICLNIVGIKSAAELINKIALFFPNIIVAIVALIFGTLFAKFIRTFIFAYLNNIGVGGAKTISIIAQYALLIFIISVALEQLAIGGQILVSAFQIAFGAVCLALALAFGIGGKDWAAKILDSIGKD